MANKQYRKVGEEFLAGGGGSSITMDIPFPAATVFAALEDGDAWQAWMDLNVNWTSPKPFGVGTTRTVSLANGAAIDEEFFAWEPGRRMAFCFVAGGLPVKAFVEDYVLEDAPGGSRLTWTLKGDAFFILKPILYKVMQSAAKKGLPKLVDWIKANEAKLAA